MKSKWNWDAITIFLGLALFWFSIILLLSSCNTQKNIWVSEAFPVTDTVTITIDHYNVGKMFFPKETYTFIDYDTLYLEYPKKFK